MRKSPPTTADSGRANRQGVSFLYLSSDVQTSVAEIRPHPGHYVSTAVFQSIENLKIADLRFIDLYKYFDDDQQLENFKMLKALSQELSIPIPPEHRLSYHVTQFISDLVRQMGFDGIAFNSSVEKGFNVVVFNPANFNYIKKSAKLLKVKSLTYTFNPVVYDQDIFFGQLTEKEL